MGFINRRSEEHYIYFIWSVVRANNRLEPPVYGVRGVCCFLLVLPVGGKQVKTFNFPPTTTSQGKVGANFGG